MSSRKVAEFPDVEAKLQKPTKQSAFEKQKAEAEAKRQREAAETAAVYEDFVKSFDRDDDDPRNSGNRAPTRQYYDEPPRPGGLGGQPPFSAGSAGRRHFGIPSGQPGLKSGPGSLGPPPMSLGKKRAYDGYQSNNRRDGRGTLSYEDRDPTSDPLSKAFHDSDEDEDRTTGGRAEEKAVSKPTLRLANLPLGTSPAVIKALIPNHLVVENVKILPASPAGGGERKSLTAIVTLSQETAATEIDAAVSALQNRYLGFGFYLSLHRHLSSAAISSNALPSITSATSTSQPFGAKPVSQGPALTPQHPSSRFAPPSSYGPAGGGPLNRGGLLHVPIQPPKDIKQLRMIHKVLESILEHGPEFEALLMSRPDVQREEKWAWIWDARSQGGIWYRWRLWEIMTGSQSKRGQGRYLPLFEGGHAWKAPDQPLAHEYTMGVQEFVSESEYNSDDDDDLDDETNKPPEPGADQENMFLNPIEKAKLVHLLARLPTTMTKIRKGDIARVTAFAITHASRGADEVVNLIVSNIERPFAYTSANPDYKNGAKDKDSHEGDSRDSSPAAEEKTSNGAPDTSASKLLGLYVVSDILSSSSTSGIRHAWRYRQLFEAALKSRKVFDGLGMMPEKMNWGRLRAEKWKRSISLILSLWEGWCVFPSETQELFVDTFENPPSLRKEERHEDEPRKEGARWKTVDATPSTAAGKSGFKPVTAAEAVEEPRDNAAHIAQPETAREADGYEQEEGVEYYTDDPEGDEEFLAQAGYLSIDGEPMVELDQGVPIGEADTEMKDAGTEDKGPDTARTETKSVGGIKVVAGGAQPRKRLRAADMFADSDSEGGA